MKAGSPEGGGIQAREGEAGPGWEQWLYPALAAYQGVGETLSSAVSFHPVCSPEKQI